MVAIKKKGSFQQQASEQLAEESNQLRRTGLRLLQLEISQVPEHEADGRYSQLPRELNDYRRLSVGSSSV